MKISHAVLATALLVPAACAKGEAEKASAAKQTWQPREAKPAQPITGAASQPAAPAAGAGYSGKVLETMDSGGYTYVHLDTGAKGKVWAAGPTTAVKVGDTVTFPDGMVMQNFASKTLNRTFEQILFVSAFQVAGGGSTAPAAHGQAAAAPSGKHPTANVEVGKVDKAAGGLTVAEVFAQAAGLSGKKVVLRGKVVKYNANIMGKNWLHVQDGSGAAGTNDLTVTSADSAEVGDVVRIEGTLVTNKDFGAGYNYKVLVEDAKLTK